MRINKFIYQYVEPNTGKMALCYLTGHNKSGLHEIVFENGTKQYVEPDNICRCTQVEDKKGNILFEKDIITVIYKDNEGNIIDEKDYYVGYRNDIGSFRLFRIGGPGEMAMHPLNTRGTKTGSFITVTNT